MNKINTKQGQGYKKGQSTADAETNNFYNNNMELNMNKSYSHTINTNGNVGNTTTSVGTKTTAKADSVNSNNKHKEMDMSNNNVTKGEQLEKHLIANGLNSGEVEHESLDEMKNELEIEILSDFSYMEKLLLMKILLKDRLDNSDSITNDPVYLTAKKSGFRSIPYEMISSIDRFKNITDLIHHLQEVIDILFCPSGQSHDVLELTYEEVYSIIIDLNMEYNNDLSNSSITNKYKLNFSNKMKNDMEYVIGVEEFNTNRNSKVIKSNLDQLYRIDPDNRRYTYLKGSCQANTQSNIVKEILKELIYIYNSYNGNAFLNFKIYAIGLPNLFCLNELRRRINDLFMYYLEEYRTTFRISSFDTEVLLKSSFASIIGSGEGLYSKATVISNESRSKNYLDYLNNHCLDKVESLMNVKKNDNALFVFMLNNEASFFEICKKHSVCVKDYVSAPVERMADIALEGNHRL